MKYSADNVTDILDMKDKLWKVREILVRCVDKTMNCVARVGASERLMFADYKISEAIGAIQKARFYMSEELDLLLKEANNDNSRNAEED
jgi:hypothetical protein